MLYLVFHSIQNTICCQHIVNTLLIFYQQIFNNNCYKIIDFVKKTEKI